MAKGGGVAAERLKSFIERIERLEVKRAPERSGWQLPRRLFPVGAFAGLVMIALLVVSNLFLWQRLNDLEVISGPLGMRAITLQASDMSRISAFRSPLACGKRRRSSIR